MPKCNCLFPGDEIKDESGCIKEEAHNDFHICIDVNGQKWRWEDDYECDCGCWDDYEKGDCNVCQVYGKI